MARKKYFVRVWGYAPALAGKPAKFNDLWKYETKEAALRDIARFHKDHENNPFDVYCEGPLTYRPGRWDRENLEF